MQLPHRSPISPPAPVASRTTVVSDRAGLADYVSLTKPRVVILMVAVADVLYLIAAGDAAVPGRLMMLTAAGFMAAGGAAVLNQYFDRDLDALMRRTRRRPLAAGRITRPERAAWVGFLLVVSGTALGFSLGPFVGGSIGLAAAVYAGIYTLILKRHSAWSTVVGGLAGCCAALAGWTAGAPLSTAGLLAVALLFAWQPAHYLPLAMARIAEFRMAGTPTLASAIGPARIGPVVAVSILATIAAATGFGVAAGLGALFAIGSLVAGALWLGVAASLTTRPTSLAAMRTFRTSGIYLAAILLLALADTMVPG